VVFVTIVEGVVDTEREDDLRTSWEATAAGTIPAGEPPAGPRMFAGAGAEPSVSMSDVEGRIRAPVIRELG
jgi:hypothetical protein